MPTYTVFFPADADSSMTTTYVEAVKTRYFDGTIFFYGEDELPVAPFHHKNIIGWQLGRHDLDSWEVSA